MNHYKWNKETDEITEVDFLETIPLYENIENRRVAYDQFDNYEVFTTFLVIDHSFLGLSEKPILFETMCTINGQWQDYQRRYTNSKDARANHMALVEHLKSGKSLEEFES